MQLYPYQIRGVFSIKRFKGRALLADEMGLGKTIQALMWLHKRKAFPCVIVCPAFLKWTWEREARNNLGIAANILSGKRPKNKQLTQGGVFIINYEILDAWVPHLKKLGIRSVILDECHYVKSRDSKRYKATEKLCEGVKYCVALSGTALTNRPAELWTTLHLVRPDLFKSFFSFAWRYCKPTKRFGRWMYKGASNLPELHSLLKSTVMIRRLKSDVLTELPSKTKHIIPMDMSDPAEYNTIKTDFMTWLKANKPDSIKSTSKAKIVVQLGVLKRAAARLKLPSVFAWIDNFLEESTGKLVVFGVHRSIVEAIFERYKGQAVLVHGGVKGKARQAAVDAFQTNKRIRVFVGNIQAAGTGLTLTAASTLAFAEIGWVPADCLQAEDRIHRIGQTKNATIYYLVARDSIEERLCEILQSKQKVLNATLDGAEGAPQFDVFDQLIEDIQYDR
jgi:SWI/SNF-related matrix-associated actin-dependent regulator 1 of chromatin subfamily A